MKIEVAFDFDDLVGMAHFEAKVGGSQSNRIDGDNLLTLIWKNVKSFKLDAFTKAYKESKNAFFMKFEHETEVVSPPTLNYHPTLRLVT